MPITGHSWASSKCIDPSFASGLRLSSSWSFREPQAKGIATFQCTSGKRLCEKKYIELRDHWIFIFDKSQPPAWGTLPVHLIFTEGLYIECISVDGRKPYGLELSHRHSCYGIIQIIFDEKEVYEHWKSCVFMQTKFLQDHFQLSDEILGRGRFSIVYKGFEKGFPEKTVAIKAINKDKLKEEEEDLIEYSLILFLSLHGGWDRNETAIMKLLNNEFIIKFFDTYHSKSILYIVTEMITDGDLYEYIAQNPKLTELHAGFIMNMLFMGVDYIHSVGVIHRDLKPENILILLGNDKKTLKSLKIIDFGLAKQIDSHSKCSEGCGTPGYMGTLFTFAFEYFTPAICKMK